MGATTGSAGARGSRGAGAGLAAPGLPARLGRFVLERFPPLAYGPLVAALVLAGQGAAVLGGGGTAGQEALRLTWATLATTAWATAVVIAGFLQLRILDEIQDEAADRLGRPDRPLPRGLVTVTELRGLALAAACLGTLLAAVLGAQVLGCYALALAQVWLLAGPSGRRRALPGGAVGDALGHSLIVPTMLAVGWAAIAPLTAHPVLGAAIVLAWAAGLALEISRKTVAAHEERPGVASYSAAIGRSRALVLLAVFVAVMGLAAVGLAGLVSAPVVVAFLPLVVVGVVLAGAAAMVGARVAIPTPALRGTVEALVLAVLLWPPTLAVTLP